MNRLFALLLVICCGSARAADPEKWSVRVDVQMVAIEPNLAITLIPELQRAETADRANKKIQAMFEREQADLLAWPCATAALGQRVVSEGGEEVRYPEYGHGLSGAPQSFWVPPAISTYYLPNHLGHSVGAQTPTAFETRRSGPVLEFEPISSASETSITMAISVGEVDFERFKEFRETPSPSKVAGTMVVADFRSRTVHLAEVTVKYGRRMLLGSFVEQRPKPRVILYLLRAQLIGKNTSPTK